MSVLASSVNQASETVREVINLVGETMVGSFETKGTVVGVSLVRDRRVFVGDQ